jgi:putative transposase
VFLDLREAVETGSTHRVARLMREANLCALHGYRIRRWAVGKPSVLIPNLLQRQLPDDGTAFVAWSKVSLR